MRIRQLALVSADLEAADTCLRSVLDLGEGFADPGVGAFGLENRVYALGDTFLEVVSPKQPDTTAGRFLEKRGGDGGYMVIVQVDSGLDLVTERERLAAASARIVFESALEDIATIHLHPADVGGAILSLDTSLPPESWRWAGPAWQGAPQSGRVLRLRGGAIGVPRPTATAARWAQVLGLPLPDDSTPEQTLTVGDSNLRFHATDDRSRRGLCEVDLAVPALEPIFEAAREIGARSDLAAGWVELVGTRFCLHEEG
jgi:hypothetical protein